MTLPEDWKGNPDGTPKIVTAVASMHGTGGLGQRDPKELVAAIEKAMADAVIQATEGEGLSLANEEHNAIIRQRQLDARQKTLDAWTRPPEEEK